MKVQDLSHGTPLEGMGQREAVQPRFGVQERFH
jgi:hypothetical protein